MPPNSPGVHTWHRSKRDIVALWRGIRFFTRCRHRRGRGPGCWRSWTRRTWSGGRWRDRRDTRRADSNAADHLAAHFDCRVMVTNNFMPRPIVHFNEAGSGGGRFAAGVVQNQPLVSFLEIHNVTLFRWIPNLVLVPTSDGQQHSTCDHFLGQKTARFTFVDGGHSVILFLVVWRMVMQVHRSNRTCDNADRLPATPRF